MEQERRIREAGQHLAEHLRAFGVVFGECAEAGIEAATLFTSAKQREIKFRQPIAQALEGFGQVAARREILQRELNRTAVRRRRWMTLELFQRDDDGQPGRGQLSELMVEISPSR